MRRLKFSGFGGVRLPPGYTTPPRVPLTWQEQYATRLGLLQVYEGAIEAALTEKRTEALGHADLFGGK